MFNVGDYAVCPGHGVGQVLDIEEKDLGGNVKKFYIVKIIVNGMKIMVPIDSKEGIRALIGTDDVDQVFTLLYDHDVEVDNSTWNRRYREYMNKIKTGSLIEIAEVLRALFLLKNRKNLSFGEKKMLDQCRNLISEEIAITKGGDTASVSSAIDSCFQVQ